MELKKRKEKIEKIWSIWEEDKSWPFPFLDISLDVDSKKEIGKINYVKHKKNKVNRD